MIDKRGLLIAAGTLFMATSPAHSDEIRTFYQDDPTELWHVVGATDVKLKFATCSARTNLDHGGRFTFSIDFVANTSFFYLSNEDWSMPRSEVGRTYDAQFTLSGKDFHTDPVAMKYVVVNRNSLDFPDLGLKGFLLTFADSQRLDIDLPKEHIGLVIDGGKAIGKSFLECMNKFQDLVDRAKAAMRRSPN